MVIKRCTMDKNTFKNMDIIGQIEFINNELKTKTMINLCKDINIGRTTMYSKLTKAGYTLSDDKSEYVNCDTKVMQSYQSNVKVLPATSKVGIKPIGVSNTKEVQLEYKDITKEVQKKDKDITKEAQKEHKSIINEVQTYENKLLELIYNKDEILEMLKNYKGITKVIEHPVLDLNDLPNNLQNVIVNKSIKIYNPVYDLFNEVCDSYKNLKKQDLISLALYEFYEKYK